jgi:TP901 family phage tail tape measure protein
VADETFEVELRIDLNAPNLRAELSRSLGDLNRSVTGFDRQIAGVQKNLDGTAAASKKAAQATRGWSQSLASSYKEAFVAEGAHLSQVEKASRQTALYNQYLYDQDKALGKVAATEGRQAAALDKSLGQRDAHVRAFQAYNKQQEAASKQTALYNQYLYDQEKASHRAAAGLSTTRYALYDVAQTATVAGAVLLGLSAVTVGVAAAWERDFAQVVRTTGVTGDAIGNLKEDLVDLAQTMPTSFGDLAQVATLGGQLGVAEQDIASFTETVIKFSTVTDLTVDAAATAFGRLDALLPDVKGNYDALGSSIAKVGVESVATESQIVAVATQISSMGVFAGLTADQVVGLSGALASVGAAPELSRGTLTRLFTEMSQAVSEGGDQLEGFAKVAGVSSDEFAASFGTEKFGPIFQSFVEGLDDTTRNGGNAVAMLDELGIKSVRDVPLLLRLAGAGSLLGDSFEDAADGFQSASELNRQYGIISETTAARIKILANNFLAFVEALGSSSLGPISNIVDALSGFLGLLRDITATPIGGFLSGVAIAFGAVLGVLGLAAGAMALFGASTLGVQQGLAGIVAIAPAATARILGAGNAAALAAGGMTASATAARLLGAALRTLSVIGLIASVPALADAFNDTMKQITGAATDAKGQIDELFGDDFGAAFIQGMTDWSAGAARAAANLGLAGYDANRRLKDLDETIADMASSGDIKGATAAWKELSWQWVENGGNLDALRAYMVDTTGALDTSKTAAESSATGMDALTGALDSVEAEAAAAEQAIDDLRDAVLNFGVTGINAEQAGINFDSALTQLRETAGLAEGSLTGMDSASISLRQSLLDMNDTALQSAAAIIENGGSMDEAKAKYMEGRQAIIDARIAKGEDADAAAAWADRVLGSAGEAEGAIRAYSDEVNKVPGAKDTKVTNNAREANGPVDTYVNNLFRIPPTRDTYIVAHYSSTGDPQVVRNPATYDLSRATGGPVYGPGTSTSDSIPVRLSNGEFVMRTAAVQKYGTGFMHAINSGRVPKFASGGSVGSSSPAQSMMGGVMELGPKSLKAISTNVTNNIVLDDVAISRAAERGNNKRRARGDI